MSIALENDVQVLKQQVLLLQAKQLELEAQLRSVINAPNAPQRSTLHLNQNGRG